MKTNTKNYKAGKKRRNTPAIVLSVILALSIVVNVLSITFGTLYYLNTNELTASQTDKVIEYRTTFDMSSGYDDIESTLLDGYTVLSEKDTDVNVPIEIDFFELTRLNVVYKQLGSITIKNAVMHTFNVGTSNKNYILFDVAKLQELLGYDSKLYVTNSVILTGQEGVGDFGIPNYCVNGMPIDNIVVRPNGANYCTHFGITLEDKLDPQYNYYALDIIHISVVLMYLD